MDRVARVAIDLSEWMENASIDEGVRLCVKFRLVETMQHGEYEYCRLTKRGIDVFCALMHMARDAADPNNVLKVS